MIPGNNFNAVAIHVGINDLLLSNKSANDKFRDIISIGLRCRHNGIRKDFISSIPYRSKINTVLTQRLNRALDDECRRNGLTFVDNSEFICQKLLQTIIVNNLIKKFKDFLESANLIRRYIFVYIFGFIFYGVSRAKTNL